MKTPYKLLLLDADNTLFDFDAAERYALHKTFSDCGWDYNDDIYTAYHQFNDRLWKELEKGTVTRDKLKILRFEQTGEWMQKNGFTLSESIDYGYMCSRYIQHLGECGKTFVGAESLCADLQKQYRLCIITNGTKSVQLNRFAVSGMDKYFEHLFISEEIGAEKPSVQFFDAVFQSYPDIPKSEMLVIGDSASSDMKGANNAGIDACYLNAAKVPDTITVRYHTKNYAELRNILL